jgi:hypothetical protein
MYRLNTYGSVNDKQVFNTITLVSLLNGPRRLEFFFLSAVFQWGNFAAFNFLSLTPYAHYITPQKIINHPLECIPAMHLSSLEDRAEVV